MIRLFLQSCFGCVSAAFFFKCIVMVLTRENAATLTQQARWTVPSISTY